MESSKKKELQIRSGRWGIKDFTLSHILVNGQAEVANDARDKPKKSKTAEGKVTKKKRRTQGREIKVINFTIILIWICHHWKMLAPYKVRGS